jgi:hypothetical protein
MNNPRHLRIVETAKRKFESVFAVIKIGRKRIDATTLRAINFKEIYASRSPLGPGTAWRKASYYEFIPKKDGLRLFRVGETCLCRRIVLGPKSYLPRFIAAYSGVGEELAQPGPRSRARRKRGCQRCASVRILPFRRRRTGP